MLTIQISKSTPSGFHTREFTDTPEEVAAYRREYEECGWTVIGEWRLSREEFAARMERTLEARAARFEREGDVATARRLREAA